MLPTRRLAPFREIRGLAVRRRRSFPGASVQQRHPSPPPRDERHLRHHRSTDLSPRGWWCRKRHQRLQPDFREPPDRNLVNFFFDGGIVFSGMLPGRPDDKFGASFIYTNMSDQARALDRDTIVFTGLGQPLRDFETVIELSYQAVVRPGWSLQPVFQYVIHPGGHVPDPIFPNLAVRSGPLLGMRSAISY